MITLIKWNGNRERALPEILKKTGRKAKEKDADFVVRKLKDIKKKKETLSLPKHGK